MWASTSMTRTEEIMPGVGFWSEDGLAGDPQPDNYAGRGEGGGRDEECVAAAVGAAAAAQGSDSAASAAITAYPLRQRQQRQRQRQRLSPGLHDLTCDKAKPVVCEERDSLEGAEGLSIYMR